METGIAGATEPRAEPDPGKPDMAAIRRVLGTSPRRLWLRRIVKTMIIVAFIPIILTILYIPSFVHPISTLMLGDLATFKGYDRQWVALDDVAPAMRRSVIMSEDGQFCSHRGVDLGELKGELEDLFAGRPTRGASTIPMQTVKNLYLWNGRSFIRKAMELPLAVYFDLVTPKDRILEIYLNIAEWGPNIYGVEAAAQNYFGVSAKNLSARQAALLTAALPNPITRNPAKPTAGIRNIARIIERRANRAGAYVGCVL